MLKWLQKMMKTPYPSAAIGMMGVVAASDNERDNVVFCVYDSSPEADLCHKKKKTRKNAEFSSFEKVKPRLRKLLDGKLRKASADMTKENETLKNENDLRGFQIMKPQ